jgi:hypothetical protein
MAKSHTVMIPAAIAPTTDIKSVALYASESAAQTASQADTTKLCFYPES